MDHVRKGSEGVDDCVQFPLPSLTFQSVYKVKKITANLVPKNKEGTLKPLAFKHSFLLVLHRSAQGKIYCLHPYFCSPPRAKYPRLLTRILVCLEKGRMDMSSHSSGSSSHMASNFINSQTTSLYSSNWVPGSAGAYAGTCMFLIVLASTSRCLFAFKAILEQRWLAKARSRRYVVIKGKGTEAEKVDSDPAAKTGALITTNGVEENVKIVQSDVRGAVPFRLSVDVPRAGLVMVIAGVGYLL
jgi:hypothetical protein